MLPGLGVSSDFLGPCVPLSTPQLCRVASCTWSGNLETQLSVCTDFFAAWGERRPLWSGCSRGCGRWDFCLPRISPPWAPADTAGCGHLFRRPGGHPALESLGHVVFFTACRFPFLFAPAKCESPSRRASLLAHGTVRLRNFSRSGARVLLAPGGSGSVVRCPRDSG